MMLLAGTLGWMVGEEYTLGRANGATGRHMCQAMGRAMSARVLGCFVLDMTSAPGLWIKETVVRSSKSRQVTFFLFITQRQHIIVQCGRAPTRSAHAVCSPQASAASLCEDGVWMQQDGASPRHDTRELLPAKGDAVEANSGVSGTSPAQLGRGSATVKARTAKTLHNLNSPCQPRRRRTRAHLQAALWQRAGIPVFMSGGCS